ncbi:hypothetical protein [Pseudoalteromonas piscicida]|uniref:hypothetical protein n=1 Tax=Pseudoalteromonas piscicida TaxID=43662 RepID=UPI001D0ABF89|nr:hypothetical protein [Pseudoalteromonas piscicida]
MRVAKLLAAKPPLTGVNQASMAKALNMSVRSMQRKLKTQRTSFRALLDQERKHRFEQLIGNTRLLDIVDALGFTVCADTHLKFVYSKDDSFNFEVPPLYR